MSIHQRLASLGLVQTQDGGIVTASAGAGAALASATQQLSPQTQPQTAPGDAAVQTAPAAGETPVPAPTATAPAQETISVAAQVQKALADDRARTNAVKASPEYTGREALANNLLSNAKMGDQTAEDIIGILASQPVTTASADADAPKAGADAEPQAVLYEDGSPVLDAHNNPVMAVKPKADANAKPQAVLYEDGSPVLDAHNNPVMAVKPAVNPEAGSTLHSFERVVAEGNATVGAGGGAGAGQKDPLVTDAKTKANVIYLLDADKEMNGGADHLDTPEAILRGGQTTPALKADLAKDEHPFYLGASTR